MAGTATNKGSQNVFFQYNDSLTSQEFDAHFSNILASGIYEGGLLTVVDDTTARVSPWSVLIGDGTYLVGARSAINYNVTGVSSSAPFIVLSWDYQSSAEWFVDVKAVAESSIGEYDVILGEALYSGSTMTGFSYAKRSIPKSMDTFLKIEPSSPLAMTVHVKGGWCTYGPSVLPVPDQTSPTFTAPTVNPRIDLVYVDSSGVVQIESGSEAAVPVAPTHEAKIVLAEITLYVGQTEIVATDIQDTRPFLRFATSEIPAIASGDSLKVLRVKEDESATEYGSPFPVGTILEYAGFTLPGGGYLWARGANVSRATYADLYDYLTFTDDTADTTSGSPVVAMDDTTGVEVGYYVEGDNIPTGTTVDSVDSGVQITLSANATATESNATIRFLPYGQGDGSTTFTLPDKRQRVGVGYESGSAEFGAMGGSYGEKTHLNTASESGVPAHTHTTNAGGGGGTAYFQTADSAVNSITSGANTPADASTPHNNIQPSIALNYIIKY